MAKTKAGKREMDQAHKLMIKLDEVIPNYTELTIILTALGSFAVNYLNEAAPENHDSMVEWFITNIYNCTAPEEASTLQ